MSSTEHYQKLIHDFCEIANLKDPLGLFDNGQIQIDGIDMLLYYDEEFAPNLLQIRVDLEEPPKLEASPDAFLKALLVSNYVVGMGGVFVFGINPMDGHVILTVQQSINDETTGSDLLRTLKSTATQATDVWQKLSGELPVSDDRQRRLGPLVRV